MVKEIVEVIVEAVTSIFSVNRKTKSSVSPSLLMFFATNSTLLMEGETASIRMPVLLPILCKDKGT